MTFENLWQLIGELAEEANRIETKVEYASVAGQSKTLLDIVDGALETGSWENDSRDNLLAMKIELSRTERITIERAYATFRKAVR